MSRSPSPPQERRALGAEVQHLTTEPRTLQDRPLTLGPPARAGGRTQQVQGAGTRGGALAFRELYFEVKAGGARASLFEQEGAPLLGAPKLSARWGCAAHGFGAPRAGRLRTPKSW